jgi:GTP-binding protein
VLLENMRREGYEVAVSRPHVVVKHIDGRAHEPFEQLTVDVEAAAQGAVMTALAARGASLSSMQPDGRGRIRLDYMIPSRGLIGFQTDFRTMTSGTGLMYHVFDHFGAMVERELGQRTSGVLISNGAGRSLAYALFALQERGRLFIGPGEDVYEGQIIGIHSRDNDLTVNPLKAKKLTNIRAAGRDENVVLTPPLRLSLEQAMEFIDEDELVEITPRSLRLRKRLLTESGRRQADRREKAL